VSKRIVARLIKGDHGSKVIHVSRLRLDGRVSNRNVPGLIITRLTGDSSISGSGNCGGLNSNIVTSNAIPVP